MGLTPHDSSPSLDAQRRLDEACARFEAQWKAGPPPVMDDFLGAVPVDERRALLRELLALDEFYRRRSGESPRGESYAERHPAHVETIHEFFADGSGRAPLPRIPGFVIERELGRGGMGVVYLAVQEQPRRQVVLKMIRDGALAHPAAVKRFQVEAHAIARLCHPNIVQVHAVGDHEGRPYMVLEYVAGGSLDRQLDGQPIPPVKATALIEQLADAVHYAHQQGVIHRDLKPANILAASGEWRASLGDRSTNGPTAHLSPFASDFKITDFGLAKLLEDGLGPLTMTGETVGTPSYMAPEQARGDSPAVGPATDVYALGALLYHLLTGKPPFVGINAVTTLEMVNKQEPTPPRLVQSAVSRDLNTIVLKCLEKSPQQRYPSALALAEDLRRLRAGRPIEARAIGRAERLARWCRRNPTAAALIGTLFVGLLAAVLFAFRLDRATRNERLAKEKSDASLLQAQESVRKSLVFLAEDDEMTRKGLFDLRLRVLKAITEQAERIRAQNGDDMLMARELAAAYLHIANLHQQLGQLPDTGRSIDTALRLFQRLAQQEPTDRQVLLGLGGCFRARGLFHRSEYRNHLAQQDFPVAVDYIRKALRNDGSDLRIHQQLADVFLAHADLEQYVKHYADAEAHFRNALAETLECKRLRPKDGRSLIAEANSRLGIAGMLRQRDQPRDAIIATLREAGTALELAQSAGLDDVALRSALAAAYAQLSRQFSQWGLFTEAEASARSGLAVLELLCQEFPAAQKYRYYLALDYFRLGKIHRILARPDDEYAASCRSMELIKGLASGPVNLPTINRTGAMVTVRQHVLTLIRLRKFDEAEAAIVNGRKLAEQIFAPVDLKAPAPHLPPGLSREWAADLALSFHSQLEIDRAFLLDAAGRYSDSLAAWDRALAMHRCYRNEKITGRYLGLASVGEFTAAWRQAKDIDRAKLTKDYLYDLARAHCRCSRGPWNDAERAEILGLAMNCLQMARSQSLGEVPDEAEALRADPVFDPLRGQADFQALLASLPPK